MHVKNWVQMTLADYPQKIAASLFCGGCNFRCPNCHNRELVLSPARLRAMGWFKPAAVRQLVDEHMQGVRDNNRAIWALFCLVLWHENQKGA